jgi:hypothetical protein
MKNITANQIGDGNLPNKYWVSISNDYTYFNPETQGYDWISDLKLFEVKGKIIKVFTTYKNALKFATEEIYLNQDYDGILIHTITIEDRISGEVFCKCYEFYPPSAELSESSREDIDFTEKELAKQGAKFN